MFKIKMFAIDTVYNIRLFVAAKLSKYAFKNIARNKNPLVYFAFKLVDIIDPTDVEFEAISSNAYEMYLDSFEEDGDEEE